MRVIVGNDHRLFADALADVLSQHGVVVTAQARTSHELFMAAASHQPDICLVADHWLTGEGLSTIRLLHVLHPAVKVVVLSDSGLNSAEAAADVGAAAIVSQHQHVTDLIEMLHRVRAGERPIDAVPAIQAVRSIRPRFSSDGEALLDALTVREQEVLMLMTDGQATKEIAKALAITLHTARTHVQSVLVKLGVHSRLQACAIVARSGVLGSSGQLAFGQEARRAGASG
jgi:two-component system, NarL family, nitrate/nitrite response regulator NarL